MQANSEQGYKRTTLLRQASFTLDVLKVLVRLAKDIKALPEGTYIQLQGQMQEVGKQLGGWIKSLTETKKPA
ncbi:four helix bundle protein [Candidatus Uhrbacteria bacterium]|nr:four helix bundle protein [Candidatus Uhrbacteria bacterium]